MNNTIDLVELEKHLEMLKRNAERTLPEDIKQRLLNEIAMIEKKLGEKNETL